MRSRSNSGVTSSSRRPVNCSGRMVARSDPEPFTQSTRVGRSRKSSSVDLDDVLPPPQLATERSAPSRLERYVSNWSGLRFAARSALQRFTGGRIGKGLSDTESVELTADPADSEPV